MDQEQNPTLQRRLELHAELKALRSNVYFQAPPSMGMVYPCIIYALDDDDRKYANNALYHRKKRYQVTHISRDPDDPVPDVLAQRPLCAFRRRFVTADLTHDVFDLFF